MGTRPKEIQTLIEWLREPGRILPKGTWHDGQGNKCALQKLKELTGINYGTEALEKVLDHKDRFRAVDLRWAIQDVNDTGTPSTVAEYLEREFPA